MPLLRNPDKSKLSKRKNPTSITFYERMGYLPQALLNYLGRMGWSMPDEREKFTLAEMIEHFDLSRVSPGRTDLRPGEALLAERAVDPRAVRGGVRP